MAKRRRRNRLGAQGYTNPDRQALGGPSPIDPRRVALMRLMGGEQEVQQGLGQAQAYIDSPLGQFSGAEYVPMASRAAGARVADPAASRARTLMDLKRIQGLMESDMLDESQRNLLRQEAQRMLGGLVDPGQGYQAGGASAGYVPALEGFLSEWEGVLGGP